MNPCNYENVCCLFDKLRTENAQLRADLDAANAAEKAATMANIGYCRQVERLTVENEILNKALAESIAAKDELRAKIASARGHMNLYQLYSCEGSDSYDPECAAKNLADVMEILK